MLFFSEDEDSEKGEGTTAGSSVIKRGTKPPANDDEKPEVGPFSYKPDIKYIKKTTNAPAWGLSKSQRITFENNAKKLTTSAQIGPGIYDYNKDAIGNTGTIDPLKGNSSIFQNQSSIFKSNVERMSYLNPKIKTFVGGKLVKGKTRTKSQQLGSEEVMMVPEISPGPGDYFATSNLSSLNVGSKPHHLQFFNSTEERAPFYENKTRSKADINSHFRGPGTYLGTDAKQRNTFHKGPSSSFISGRDRDLLFGGNPNPGPGNYRQANGINRLEGKVWSKI
mmetsp:Transcript_42227/g.49091  ORF Transcript_42227/g.49091 Transcript_42227/m.49091 type:complete len:279 (-) Transcript_42227:539-1375(-)